MAASHRHARGTIGKRHFDTERVIRVEFKRHATPRCQMLGCFRRSLMHPFSRRPVMIQPACMLHAGLPLASSPSANGLFTPRSDADGVVVVASRTSGRPSDRARAPCTRDCEQFGVGRAIRIHIRPVHQPLLPKNSNFKGNCHEIHRAWFHVVYRPYAAIPDSECMATIIMHGLDTAGH